MALKVCVAGATGWAGSALASAIGAATDMELVSAVSRSTAGRRLSDVLQGEGLACPVFPDAAQALALPCDVFVEFTHPEVAKHNVRLALDRGAHVVVGTSGLSEDDYMEIGHAADAAGRGVLACGNFALTVVLLQKFAQLAAAHIGQWEIVDYADAAKPDAPSGTARELAHLLSRVRGPEPAVPIAQTVGPVESRGATVCDSQIHSIRLPGYVISVEIIFGMPDQKLIIRHEAGSGAQPYVEGAMLAIRRVSSLVGLTRGLESVVDLT